MSNRAPRQSDNASLLVAVVVSVVLHLLLLPVAARSFSQQRTPQPLIEPQPLPDLAVTAVTAPAAVTVGKAIDLSIDIRNAGEADLDAAAWTDRLYLSPDEQLDSGDVQLHVWKHHQPLAAGEAYTLQRSGVVLPKLPGEKAYVIAVADADGKLPDARRSNNTRTTQITWKQPATAQEQPQTAQPAPADLVVEDVIAPEKAKAGTAIKMSWSVLNKGPHAAQGAWLDRVYLSTDDKLDANDSLLAAIANVKPLAVNETYVQYEAKVVLPRNASGKHVLVVSIDDENVVVETDDLNNNRGSVIEIIPNDELVLGEENAPNRTTVAWIPHESFEKLIALKAESLQPGIQKHVDPTPGAPMTVIDPTPPAPQPSKAARPTAPPTASKATVQPKSVAVSPALAKIDVESPQTAQVARLQPREAAPTAPTSAAALPSTVERRGEDEGVALDDDRPDMVARAAEAIRQVALPPDRVPSPKIVESPNTTHDLDAEPDETMQLPQPVDAETAKTDTPAEADGPADRVEPADGEQQPRDAEAVDAASDAKTEETAEAENEPDVTNPEAMDDPQKPSPDSPESNPTSADRSDQDVAPFDPLQSDKPLHVRPGQVLVGHGLKVKIAQPRFATASRYTANPDVIVVSVTFKADGTVTNAGVLQSTGYTDIDASVWISLYNWTAEGERLKDAPIKLPPIVIHFR